MIWYQQVFINFIIFTKTSVSNILKKPDKALPLLSGGDLGGAKAAVAAPFSSSEIFFCQTIQ